MTDFNDFCKCTFINKIYFYGSLIYLFLEKKNSKYSEVSGKAECSQMAQVK